MLLDKSNRCVIYLYTEAICRYVSKYIALAFIKKNLIY